MLADTAQITLLPAVLIDSIDRLVLVILADNTIGISIRRFDGWPQPNEIATVVTSEQWVSVFRDTGGQLYLMDSSADGTVTSFAVQAFQSAQANESAQLAIEVALANWPEWGGELRQKYRPRNVIPFPATMPEA